MTPMSRLSRRSFVASVAALGGGLALGFHLPTGARPARGDAQRDVRRGARSGFSNDRRF